MYKDTTRGMIVRLADGADIPKDPRNADYQRALAWIGEGNTLMPADPAPPREPALDIDDVLELLRAKGVLTKAEIDAKKAAKPR